MLSFGTLGAAKITPQALIYPCINEPRARVSVLAARDRARAESFAQHHHIHSVVDDYAAVVEHDEVQAIYVPLPISAHCEWTLAALAAGKHVLCEKSFASNAEEATRMAVAAKDSERVVMDAFHYRYHPLFVRAKSIVDSGVLGKLVSIDAAFHIPVIDPADIRMNYATGGGVTMDIGCYPISWVRHIMGEEPEEVAATAECGPEHVDVLLQARLTFANGVVATTSGDMRKTAQFSAYLCVVGADGQLLVNNPLAPQLGHSLELTVAGQTTTEQLDRRPSYAYQLDAFLAAVDKGEPLATDADDAVAQMRVIDRCYRAAGLPERGLA